MINPVYCYNTNVGFNTTTDNQPYIYIKYKREFAVTPTEVAIDANCK